MPHVKLSGGLPAHLTIPPVGPGPWPGVVVIHEVFGVNDDIREQVGRLAAAGYLALAPDLVLAFSDLQADLVAELIRRNVAVHAFNQRDVAGILDMIRTVGALTGAQAVQMVKAGLGAIYVSGWQVAADANLAGHTYPDQSL